VFDEITRDINNTNNTYKSHGKLDILEIVTNFAILLLLALKGLHHVVVIVGSSFSSLKELQNYMCHSLSFR